MVVVAGMSGLYLQKNGYNFKNLIKFSFNVLLFLIHQKHVQKSLHLLQLSTKNAKMLGGVIQIKYKCTSVNNLAKNA